MNRIEVKDLPANATAYQLDDGRIYRIHLNLLTPTNQIATADHVEVETRGYLIDKSGAMMVDDNQEPIMLPTMRARVPLGNIRAGTDTAKPGWVVQNLPQDEAARDEATKGAKKLKALPKTGEVGDRVMVGDDLYAYAEGVYESVRKNRLFGLAPLAAAPMDDTAIDSLIP